MRLAAWCICTLALACASVPAPKDSDAPPPAPASTTAATVTGRADGGVGGPLFRLPTDVHPSLERVVLEIDP